MWGKDGARAEPASSGTTERALSRMVPIPSPSHQTAQPGKRVLEAHGRPLLQALRQRETIEAVKTTHTSHGTAVIRRAKDN